MTSDRSTNPPGSGGMAVIDAERWLAEQGVE